MKQSPFEELEAALSIDKNNLDEALLAQPDTYYRVSEALVLVASQRDAAKQALTETEAEIDQQLRVKARTNDLKLTETDIQSQKNIHPDVKSARFKLNELNTKLGKLEALKEAFQQRSYVLKELVALYTANYFGDVMTSSATRNQGVISGAEGRRQLNKARRERM